jgi:putative transcriptional regulator
VACRPGRALLHANVWLLLMKTRKRRTVAWDAGRVRALRKHLKMTQQELAEQLGTRQQTISEWETGMYNPRGTSSTLLGLVAERSGFKYRSRMTKRAEGGGGSQAG